MTRPGIKHPTWAFGLGLPLVSLFACAAAKPPYAAIKGPPPVSAADRLMAHFADMYLDQALRLHPVRSSAVGYHKWDHLLPDYSKEGEIRALVVLKQLDRDLGKIDKSQLSPSWAADHDLIEQDLKHESFLWGELRPTEWNVQLYNQDLGGAIYYLTIPPADPKKWPERLDAILARLHETPRFVDTAKKNLKNPPRVFTEFVIKQNPGNIEVLEKQLPELFVAYPKLAERLNVENPKAIAALKDFQSFLENDLLHRSTGDYRLGRDRWERLLEMTLASGMKSDEIYREAEKALEATRFEMYDLARPIFAEQFPDDHHYEQLTGDDRINYVVGRVIAESSKEHGTPDSIFDDVGAQTARIKKFIMDSDLIALPPATDSFVIERTPPFLDGAAVAFFHPAPAFEPDLKKSFWISSVPKPGTADAESYLKEYNRFTIDQLIIHEAFPGHYVQSYWSEHSPFASISKEVLESGSMVEGWACMVEELVHRAGFSKADPKNRLFHLKMSLRPFLNAMIDAKLHTSSGDDKDLDRWVIDLLTKKGFQEEAEATRKLRRAKLTATQLSTYFVGYREMMDIYEAGKKKAGSSFKPRVFLEKMVSYGSIPPRMIRALLENEGLI
jgi:uncharacterized protein (DUF885 family)